VHRKSKPNQSVKRQKSASNAMDTMLVQFYEENRGSTAAK
jgi:hypothetical protein